MKQLIIAFMLLATLKANSQECVKFVQPKWTVEIYNTIKPYNVQDYEWKLVDSAKSPILKPIYKTEIVRDAYTGLDTAEYKKSGKICTKNYAAQYITVIDRYEVLKPAVPPTYAWLPKNNTNLTSTFRKEKNVKDGYLTISNCE